MLWVVDGAKALRRAIGNCFVSNGMDASALVQRCQESKRRNSLEYLPESLQYSAGAGSCCLQVCQRFPAHGVNLA
jgi:hypothetical protein